MAMETVQTLFRYVHAVGGIVWIGMAFYMSFILVPNMNRWTPDQKFGVLPGLLTASTNFGRWSSLFTWVTGLLLLGLVFHAGGLMFDDPTRTWSAASGIMVLVAFLSFGLYDVAVKFGLLRTGTMAGIVGLAGTVAMYEGMLVWAGMGYRATLIHIGVAYGTIMTANVWMRVVPSFRRVIAALSAGTPPDQNDLATAGLRARHNTFMAVPILWTMLNLHTYVPGYESPLWFYGIVAGSWLVVSFMLHRAAATPTTSVS